MQRAGTTSHASPTCTTHCSPLPPPLHTHTQVMFSPGVAEGLVQEMIGWIKQHAAGAAAQAKM